MESIAATLDLRGFHALLTGIIQINYHHSSNVTYDILINKLYANSELSHDEVRNEINLFETVSQMYSAFFLRVFEWHWIISPDFEESWA